MKDRPFATVAWVRGADGLLMSVGERVNGLLVETSIDDSAIIDPEQAYAAGASAITLDGRAPLQFLSDNAVAWSNELQVALEKEERLPTADERSLDVKYGREITDRTDELAVAWWKQTIARMAPAETVPMMAAWMVDPAHITAVIDHWRSRPSRSGGR